MERGCVDTSFLKFGWDLRMSGSADNENLTLDFKLTLQKERRTDGRYVPPDGRT